MLTMVSLSKLLHTKRTHLFYTYSISASLFPLYECQCKARSMIKGTPIKTWVSRFAKHFKFSTVPYMRLHAHLQQQQAYHT